MQISVYRSQNGGRWGVFYPIGRHFVSDIHWSAWVCHQGRWFGKWSIVLIIFDWSNHPVLLTKSWAITGNIFFHFRRKQSKKKLLKTSFVLIIYMQPIICTHIWFVLNLCLQKAKSLFCMQSQYCIYVYVCVCVWICMYICNMYTYIHGYMFECMCLFIILSIYMYDI